MKAIRKHRYGGPDVLTLEDVDLPELAPDRVRVRVRAASVNALDWHLLRARPHLVRLTDGLRRPRSAAVGVDAAGVVEAVGADVTGLRPGDAVFGISPGAFAEYVDGATFVRMPAGTTFAQAAALPTAASTALQALRDKAGLTAGQRVLVIGAGGGVGTYAVQIAAALGAEVTALTKPASATLVGELGAAHVVDHTVQGAGAPLGDGYDVVFDNGGRHSLRRLRRALVPGGVALLVAPGPGDWVGPITHVLGATISNVWSRRAARPFLAHDDADDLRALATMVEAGRLRSVVDRTFPLADTAAAVRLVETGPVTGKVVVDVDGAHDLPA